MIDWCMPHTVTAGVAAHVNCVAESRVAATGATSGPNLHSSVTGGRFVAVMTAIVPPALGPLAGAMLTKLTRIFHDG